MLNVRRVRLRAQLLSRGLFSVVAVVRRSPSPLPQEKGQARDIPLAR